ncbi:MAG: tetratricopeptide repeat protein [Anaerolineae bacterium]|nr:tetratricopeptide repeat protein [Anaerolineae bacterium]
MYLRTPKRYQAKGRRRYLFNFKWLWLYLLAPLIIVPASLAYYYRAELAPIVSNSVNSILTRMPRAMPTATPTIPAADLQRIFGDSVRTGKINNALSALNGLLDAAPNDVYLHTTLVRMTLLRGDPTDRKHLDKAVAAADAAINANPEVADGWIMMALALNERGEPRAALPYALRARDLNADDPMLGAVTARIYADLGRYDEATTLVEQAIDKAKASRPLNTIALAFGYWVQGDILTNTNGAAAEGAYEEAWRAALTDANVPLSFIAYRLYFVYLTENRDQDVLNVLAQAAERDHDDDMNSYYVGQVYYRAQNWEKARPAYAQCLDLNPDNLRCLRRMAQVNYQLNAYATAADYAKRAIAKGTQEPEAFLVAGLSLIEGKDRNCGEAITLLQKGYLLNEGRTDVADTVKASQRDQFERGLTSCNARPIQPTTAPAATATPQ